MTKFSSFAILAALTTPALADTDAKLAELGQVLSQSWYEESTGIWNVSESFVNGFEPASCTTLLADLQQASAKSVVTLDNDIPTLKAGDHTLAEARTACAAIERQGKVRELERWLKLAAEGESTAQITVYQGCKEVYDKVIAAGIPGTTKVPAREVYVNGKPTQWQGSIESLRIKFCDAPLKRAEEVLEQRAAPYKAVLKADKLAMALGYNVTAVYTLAGGDTSMDPKKLAAATYWFDVSGAASNEAQTCGNGKARTFVRKYEFDKQHELVTTTQREYCGSVEAKMFK